MIIFDERKRLVYFRGIINRKKGKVEVKLTDVFNSFIGKDCIFTLSTGKYVTGVLESISEGWLSVRNPKNGVQAVNSDYISDVKEIPKNKNGRRKRFYLE